MSTFSWYALQIVVAMIVFVTIGETVGVADRGLAPAIVSLGIAYGVTVAVSNFVDWRRRRLLRRFAVSDELQRHAGGGVRALRHASDGPELPRRRRISQNPRKLI
jgi:hypothetical protein